MAATQPSALAKLPSPERTQQAVDDTMAPEPEDVIIVEKNPRPLDEDDTALIKTYVSVPRPDWSLLPVAVLVDPAWFTARVRDPLVLD